MKPAHIRHRNRFRRKIVFSLFMLVMVLGLPACKSIGDSGFIFNQRGTYAIDRKLEDFYTELDGKNLLGPAISPLLDQYGKLCQYTITALLCFDPQATGLAHFKLAPLGLAIGVTEKPAADNVQQTDRIVDGYVIHPAFLQLYDHFYGSLFAGKPLTNAFYNPARNRIEQYFENLGFYQLLNVPGDGVGLIEYGQWICRDACPQDPQNAIAALDFNIKDPHTDFMFAIELLGGESFFGKPLTDLFIASDGNLEMVYEHAAVFAPPDHPRDVQLRPLTALLNIPVAAPGPQQYSAKDQMSFYPTDGELGYHIPLVFERFIQQHGGMGVFGKPLSDPALYPGSDLPRQCFENYCLEYDKESSVEKVRFVNLGQFYLDQVQPEMKPFSTVGAVGGALANHLVTPGDQISFIISESHPQLGKNEVQTIRVTVFERETHETIANVRATLTVTKAGEILLQTEFPPTSADGTTSLDISPLPGVSDGDFISYQVSLILDTPQSPWLKDGYLIWGN